MDVSMKFLINYSLRLLMNFHFFKKCISFISEQRSLDNYKFYKANYDSRVKKIKELHNLNIKTKTYKLNDSNFSSLDKIKSIRIVDDFLQFYAKNLKFKNFLQLGAWHLGDLRIVFMSGFKGKLIASDYSKEFLNFLKKFYTNSKLKNVEFIQLDLENINKDSFKDIEFLSAIQVLSNIQPESISKLFYLLKNSSVKLFVIGDMCSNKSLGVNGETSLSKKNLNWYHPYQRLASINNFDSFFIPDCQFSDEDEKRGIFIIYRDINFNIHKKVFAESLKNFALRQKNFKWK